MLVEVNEVTGRGGQKEMTTRKRYTRIFQCLTSDPSDGVLAVRDGAGIPSYGDEYEEVNSVGVIVFTDPLAFMVEKRAAQTDPDNLQNWMVTCEYVGLDDPTFEPPDVQWTEEKYQIAIQQDATGKLIANSAGVPFEHGLTIDRTRMVLIVTENVLFWDPTEAQNFRDTLNGNYFLATRYPPGFAPLTCKLDSLQATAVYYADYTPTNNNIFYWRRTAKIAIDPAGWAASVLDAGYEQLVTSITSGLTTAMKIIDGVGGHPSTPYPLDGSGHKLVVGANPVYLSFEKYPAADWTTLALEY